MHLLEKNMDARARVDLNTSSQLCVKLPEDQQFPKNKLKPIWCQHPCHGLGHRDITFSSSKPFPKLFTCICMIFFCTALLPQDGQVYNFLKYSAQWTCIQWLSCPCFSSFVWFLYVLLFIMYCYSFFFCVCFYYTSPALWVWFSTRCWVHGTALCIYASVPDGEKKQVVKGTVHPQFTSGMLWLRDLYNCLYLIMISNSYLIKLQKGNAIENERKTEIAHLSNILLNTVLVLTG